MNLQPVLKHRLLPFEAMTSVFLDINGREKLGIGSLIQYSAVLRDPLPGPLFEFKSVLQDSARTSEDVGHCGAEAMRTLCERNKSQALDLDRVMQLSVRER
jgi:hypothetical protein